MLLGSINKNYSKGFTLIDIMVVIGIITVLCVIVVPSYFKYIKHAKEKVCNANCLQLEKKYNLYLEAANIEHNEAIFEQFLQNQSKNICPEHGRVIYVDGKVRCSVHVRDNGKKGNEDKVPFLE